MAEEEKAGEPAAPRPPLGAERRMAPRFASTLSITCYPAGGGWGSAAGPGCGTSPGAASA
jgi:hypothetical protein